MDMYGFYTGKIFDAYEYLGCHWNEKITTFRVFAPAAEKISVIGDFNDWIETPMQKVYDGNFWECQLEGIQTGMRYKYRIYRKDGGCIDHCDPYGYGMEFRPGSASIVRDLGAYKFHDNRWMRLSSMMMRSKCAGVNRRWPPFVFVSSMAFSIVGYVENTILALRSSLLEQRLHSDISGR